ncbi:hypothetical protein ACFT5B_06925 [Luteimicrobium sp. NPDC057192]|uniref:hypothetical protein n=1 Tax=Luteimicrobium sp. NPDC057192 TaxID=3346042 RepID=UPI0036256395
MTVTLTESRPLTEAATPADGPARLLVKIISPGWGSSGYYSTEALQAAAGPEIFPAGTQMFLDHPTATEQWERPERTVKDLAAVTTEDARWDPSIGALVAEARVFAPWRQPIADMADAIGVSIRAAAEVEQGEAEGRRGTIITALTEGYSIDFVTKAGRGGAILAVREADVAEARNVGQWMEARIHQGFTNIADDMFADGRLTREERIALSSAIGDALTAFVQSVDTNAPQLYTRDLWDDPDDTPQVAETNPATEADPSVPTSPAGQPTATESLKEDTMAQTQIEESELATLRTDAGRATVLESERDAAIRERDEARTALVEAQDVAAARTIVGEADVEFDDLQTAGLIAGAPRIAESGRIDLDAFRTQVTERAARLAESQGAGRVRGVGQTTTPDTDDLSEADLDRELAKLNGRTVKEA